MTEKVNQLGNSITGAFKSLKNKFKVFMFPELKEQLIDTNIIEIKSKTKKAFCDFVEEESAQRETESPEYVSLRSEPTALMSTAQLATLHGKRVESHVVLTKDGYLLTLHRLRNSFEEGNKIGNFTVLLHHGLLGSSADWILLGPENSLPYILSSGGCDVWLANARGNYYSRGHVSSNVDSLEFWDFSFHEMGQFDLPAVVEYIKKVKNSDEKINFIGHSMGATAFLVMLSTYPDYNKYFRIAIFLAPLAYMSNSGGPLKILTQMAKSPPEQLLKLLGEGEFVPNRKIPIWIANKYCSGPDMYCVNPLLFLSGSIPEEHKWNKSLRARILYHIPAGGSTKTILHFAQMVNSEKFHKYNHENEEYPLRLVTVPIVMFSSNGDLIATISDVLRLYFSISSPIDHYVIRDKNLSHVDFLWNPHAKVLVYEKVIDFLSNGLNLNASKANEIMW
nr:lipase 3-like [Vanessa tameamea]